MIYEMTANLFCAFIGTVGYSVLYNVPKRYFLSCGFTGTMGWLAFLLVKTEPRFLQRWRLFLQRWSLY